MKINALTTALTLGLLSSSAQAVNLSPDGLGQVLFYPYYTVNGGNDTLMSLVNSTDEAKAVKVRFMEGKNSREVLDFNLYLSAKDVWTAAITLKDGTPTLVIHDTSCTTPYLYPATYQEFLPFAMEQDADLSRMNEGHIEVIEMGTVVGPSAVAATHVDGFPEDCQFLNDAWTQVGADKGYWLEDPHTDMEAPSGGLYGGAAVINVEFGTMYSFEAKAINGFASKVGDLHQVPGTVLPSLDSGDVKTASIFLDDGTVKTTPAFGRGVDAISYVFMHDELMNEYTVNPDIGALTDWIITFPTKSFYVDEQVTGVDAAVAPFTSTWDGEKACETVLVDSVYDREEATIVYEPGVKPPVVSPALPDEPEQLTGLDLCYETNVIQFGDKNIFDSKDTVKVDPTVLGFTEGWASLDMHSTIENNAYTQRVGLGDLRGLPVVGFAVFEYENNYLTGDVKANYGGLFEHKSTRALVSGSK